LKQTDETAYVIFNKTIYRSMHEGFEDFRDLINAGGVREEASVGELAAIYRLDAENLKKTVDAYNSAMLSGSDEFGRTSFGEELRPPLYGVKVTAALFHTQGGLKIDTRARVLRNDGTVIPNLYAGGGVAVGISGKGSDGYLAGNGLLTALAWGKIAGEDAARSIKTEFEAQRDVN
jgi:fumarate reductase flavoprotein subunit